jgi:hypothetical protein
MAPVAVRVGWRSGDSETDDGEHEHNRHEN